ncbi:MAG: hypothetical protein OIN66_09315 [Candidatus Methanoperedens sp.]|nr:hypothetical protein [Candidatus Methanoperedens sp.]
MGVWDRQRDWKDIDNANQHRNYQPERAGKRHPYENFPQLKNLRFPEPKKKKPFTVFWNNFKRLFNRHDPVKIMLVIIILMLLGLLFSGYNPSYTNQDARLSGTNLKEQIFNIWDNIIPKSSEYNLTNFRKPIKQHKLVGKWKATIPVDNIETVFVFKNDNTGIWEHPVFGKMYFNYRISDDKIIMSELEPCIDNGLYNCRGDAPIPYQFYNDDVLFLTFGLVKLSFERQWY